MSTSLPVPTLSNASVPLPSGAWDSDRFAAEALSSPARLASVIDHTLLRAEATRAQLMQLCHDAAEYRFACAMVNPYWVATAVEVLAGTGIPVGVVVGFPLGASLSSSKRDETARVLKLGAHDVDVVLNIGLLKSGTAADLEAIRQEIASLAQMTHDAGAVLKVILETCLLSFEEKLRAAEIALSAGADFLKTSTGFSNGGATADDVTLLREQAGVRAGVKASGGIRSLTDAAAMLSAGASRIGASASTRILAELSSRATDITPTAGY